MVRCDEFYVKWQKVGNFCNKNPKTAAHIERYLDELLRIEAQEPIGSKNLSLSEGAARPLYQEKDKKVHDEAVKQVVTLARSKEAEGKEPVVTAPEVVDIIHNLKPDVVQEPPGDNEMDKDVIFLLATFDTLIDERGWSIEQIKHVVDYRVIHGDGTLPPAPMCRPRGESESISTQLIVAYLLDLISSLHKNHGVSFDEIRERFNALISQVAEENNFQA